MEETYLVLMLREKATGFLDKEINAYKINENEEYLVNIFAEEEEGEIFVHAKLSLEGDCQDWEFDAIYDYYDESIFKDKCISFQEVEGSYNPTWEIVFKYIDDDREMEAFILNILSTHKKDLDDVYLTIKDKKDEYVEL